MDQAPSRKAVVVVPTKNEGPKLSSVIHEIRQGFQATPFRNVVVLVVDDSNDDTKAIAAQAGAVVVRGTGEGLGAAMYRGLKSALTFNPDAILIVDGDGQADAATEIPRFLEPLERGEADLVVGSRFLERGLVQYRYPLINRFGTIVLSAILRSQTGLPLTDSHGGIRAMRPEVAAELDMFGTHTYVQESIIDAAEKGFRIKEIPSVWRKREVGTSRVVKSIPRYVFYTLPILLLRSGQHIRGLYMLGILSCLMSFLVFATVLIEERTLMIGHRTPALILIALLFTTGIQLFFFGFTLQLINQIKRNVDRLKKPELSPYPVPEPRRGAE
jgi:glycosyltransferase involved in cell wall biosynthesis